MNSNFTEISSEAMMTIDGGLVVYPCTPYFLAYAASTFVNGIVAGWNAVK